MKKETGKVWELNIDIIQNIVTSNRTMLQVLKKLELSPGQRKTLIKRLVKENINFSHIPLGARANLGRPTGTAKKIEELLTVGSKYNRCHLKYRLLKDGTLENKCYKCGIGPEWNGEVLVLQLDHINGINDDNRLSNLRMLCPNCHTQTTTYCGKNFPKRDKVTHKCILCGGLRDRRAKHKLCVNCYAKKRKRDSLQQ